MYCDYGIKRETIDVPVESGDMVYIVEKDKDFHYYKDIDKWFYTYHVIFEEGIITAVSINQNKKGEWKKTFRVHKMNKEGKAVGTGDFKTYQFEDVMTTVFPFGREKEAMDRQDQLFAEVDPNHEYLSE